MSTEENNYTLPDRDAIAKLIGLGGYSKVTLVKHECKILARKEVNYNNENARKVDDTIHEIEVLKELKHENIVELEDYYIDNGKNIIYIYTKYYERGDLCGIIKEKKEKREDFSFDVYIYIYYFRK